MKFCIHINCGFYIYIYKKKGPRTNITLAIGDCLPDVVIPINTVWEDKKVLDKREI